MRIDVKNCPQGIHTTVHYSVNTCIRLEYSTGCTEIHYSTHNVRCSNISGEVKAIGLRRLDGFRNVNLNCSYLDGVSVNSNNEHVWSFAGGYSCEDINNSNKPRFVEIITHVVSLRICGCISSADQILYGSSKCCLDITVRVCTDEVIVIKILL